MISSRLPVVVTSSLLILAIVAIAIWFLRVRDSRNASHSKTVGPSAKLVDYMSRNRQYTAYIGVPCFNPTRWVRMRRIEGTEAICDQDERHPLNDVRSWIVAYPNGEVLEQVNVFSPLPEGLKGLESGRDSSSDILKTADLTKGAKFMTVTHGEKRLGSSSKLVYETTLTNVGSEPVQVLRFAGYAIVGGQWRINTVSGSYYSGEQFRAWYGMGESEWIEPGQTVSDPDNYGGPYAMWAYFCRTKSGQEFVAGAEVR